MLVCSFVQIAGGNTQVTGVRSFRSVAPLNRGLHICKTPNALFHRGSMQVKDSGDTALLVLLVAASQIPDDRNLQIPTQREDQSIALSHVVIRHTSVLVRARVDRRHGRPLRPDRAGHGHRAQTALRSH